MRKAMIPLARLLDTVQRRFQRSRAGSVMILVVTLLVLMAIIGTAFLTTARNDRYSSQLHESNVEVDMLLDGVKNIILGRMAGENFLDPNGQRWDDVHSDNWLASRTPMMMINACGVWTGARTYNRGDWVQVTTTSPPSFYVSVIDNNLNHDPTVPDGSWMNDSQAKPDTPCWEGISSLFDLIPGIGISAEDLRGPQATPKNTVVPATFDGTRGRNLVQLIFADASGSPAGSVQSNGQNYPALRYFRPGNPNDNPPTKDDFVTTLAASASGNGIADSFLWRLPMGEINGVTYYAAVRVIDNNSAINLNTAGSSLYDFDAQGAPLPNMGFFPGNTGIAELLSTFNLSGASPSNLGNEFAALNLYRDTGLRNYANGNNVPLPDGIISQLNPNNMGGPTAPIADFQGKWGTRPEFRYMSLADAQFMGLGRRIDLPGYSLQATSNSPPYQYNNFSWGDSAALAYFFDLVSPATAQSVTGNGGGSIAENVLGPSLWQQNYYRSRPWDPSPTNPPYTQNWFNLNYVYTNLNYDIVAAGITTTFDPTRNLSNTFNRRPLVVARNPLSNMMPVHIPEMDALRSWAPYITVAMGYNLDPNTLDPSRGNMPRVSLNTASPLITFPPSPALPAQSRSYSTEYPIEFSAQVPAHTPTLWLGFYNAMLPALEPPYTDVRLFSGLNFQLPAATTSTNYFRPAAAQPYYQLAQQFRSSLRDPSGIGPYIPNRTPPPNGTAVTSISDPDANVWLPPASELLLRSLIAAVNTQDIRDSDDDVSSSTVFGLPVISGGAYMNGGAKVTVYGTERQPFITEIYVNNDTTQQPANFQGAAGPPIPNNVSATMANPVPYVAVELYNPYDVAISLSGYTLAALNRTTTTFPAMALRQIGTPLTLQNATIPARGFLVLESVDVAHNKGTYYRPWWTYPGTTVSNDPIKVAIDQSNSNYCFVSGLDTILTDPNTGNADELYLLKPRNSDGSLSFSFPVGSFQKGIFYDETANLADMVPVDSFDFFGMGKSPDGKTFQAWHYVRGNTIYGDANGATPVTTPPGPRPSWKFVFAGHWEPGQLPSVVTGTTVAPPPPPPVPPGTTTVREEGVVTGPTWTNGTIDQWILTPPGYVPGGPATQSPDGPTAPISMGSADFASSYYNYYPGIPLNNTGYGNTNTPEPTWHGLNKNLTSNAFNSYPFGGFARNGDLLQVPFVGGYTITYNGAVVEMNPVTKDVGFADDNNLNYILNVSKNATAPNPAASVIAGINHSGRITTDGTIIQFEDNEEQVGRFVPLSSVDGDPANFLPVYSTGLPPLAYSPPGAPRGLAYSFRGTDGVTPDTHLFDTYGWASGVFDYFSTLQSPNDDYLPHTKPEYYDSYTPFPATPPAVAGYTSPDPFNRPVYVANSPAGTSTPNGASEAAAPIEGLININTAPWKVLAQVPFFPVSPRVNTPGLATNSTILTANIEIAQAIVRYRNEYGPFHSIFDLNRVVEPYLGAAYTATTSPLFQNVNGLPPDTNDYQSYQGVLTPNLPGFVNDGGNNNGSVDPYHLPDGLFTDFNQREAQVMRLSNLITTRSDSFTVYLQVQGWRGAGTPGAQLVVQRRAAFIMDRSGSTRSADNKSNTTNVISVNIPTKVQTQ